jgi:O-antigen/teichoic acid export membrane protein
VVPLSAKPVTSEKPKLGRKDRAVLNVVFSYGNLGIALAAAFILTPLILHRIDTRQYGYWLSSGEILGYAALFDMGVLGLVPWLIAEADGRDDAAKIRWLVSHAMTMAIFVMIGFIITSAAGAWLLSHAQGMNRTTWSAIISPLFIMVALMAASYCLMAYQALLSGLQDVTFLGFASAARSILSFALVAFILCRGGQLYALAIGTALPNLLMAIASFFRARYRYPELCHNWPRPSIGGIKALGKESIGPWIGTLGLGFIERSQAVVITGFGRPELAPVYVGTAKLTQVFANVISILLDSALVGVAQLNGENQESQKREVILALLRIQLVASGLIACLALAINPSFVCLWIGPRFFGGLVFNALLAMLLLVAGLTYSVVKIVAVQGQRLAIGRITVIQGLAHLLLTILLGALFGLSGMVLGAILACAFITLRESTKLLRSQIDLEEGELSRLIIYPWAIRAAALLALSALIGVFFRASQIWQLLFPSGAIIFAYVYWMRPYWKGLPLPATLNYWLTRVGLGA